MKLKEKRIAIIIVAALAVAVGLFVFNAESVLFPEYEPTQSVEFAKALGKGWNLGNTFDACEKQSKEKMGLESETMWGNPETTKELIAFVKECGFDTLRLPVTWSQHLNSEYIIDTEWLERVAEVVDFALECGLKVVLNTHHEDAFWLIADDEHKKISGEILCKVWAQICERFKDYDESLVFETMNEPRVFGGENEWYGSEETREAVNYLNFAALETIRNSGGKNAERYVLIPTFAASGLDENIDALRLPDDERVIVSVHYYYNTAHQSEFADNEKAWNVFQKIDLYMTFRRMAKRFIAEGYGVCKSEFGWTDRENLGNLAENASFYVDLAERFGIPVMVWDNGITDGSDIHSFGLIDRREFKVVYPEYLEAIV